MGYVEPARTNLWNHARAECIIFSGRNEVSYTFSRSPWWFLTSRRWRGRSPDFEACVYEIWSAKDRNTFEIILTLPLWRSSTKPQARIQCRRASLRHSWLISFVSLVELILEVAYVSLRRCLRFIQKYQLKRRLDLLFCSPDMIWVPSISPHQVRMHIGAWTIFKVQFFHRFTDQNFREEHELTTSVLNAAPVSEIAESSEHGCSGFEDISFCLIIVLAFCTKSYHWKECVQEERRSFRIELHL